MNTELGKGKIYLKAEDLGKMLKLKDINNLVVTNINIRNSKDVEIEIATPMCNSNNYRVKSLNKNKTFHIGLDYIPNFKGVSISIFKEEKGKYILNTLKNDKNSLVNIVTDIIDKFKDNLNDCIFYVNNIGFGIAIYDSLISLGIKKENIVLFNDRIYSKDKQTLLETAKNIKVELIARQEYLRLIGEMNSLEQILSYNKPRLKNNNPSGLLEAFLMPLIYSKK